MKIEKLLLLLSVFICFLAMLAANRGGRKNKAPHEFENKGDSLFIVHRIEEYGRRDWGWFQNYARMYQITNDKVVYFVDSIFYSADKNKLVVWVGEKMYNAPTIRKYSTDEHSNRLCPSAGDTVYHMGVLIGYRNSPNDPWKLYPWGNRQVPCCNSIAQGVKELKRYYYLNIKEDILEVVDQQGDSKGVLRRSAYMYGINENEFWSKSPVWQRDSVGANNLYPFEVKYSVLFADTCFKCAEKIEVPQLNNTNGKVAN